MKTIYKHEGKTVWYFSFLWIDDATYNEGYKELKGSFIGTKKGFDEMVIAEQNGNGFGCWNVKKRHADWEEYCDFINNLD